jgi:hypothetical protein
MPSACKPCSIASLLSQARASVFFSNRTTTTVLSVKPPTIASNYFHPGGDAKCKKCGNASIAITLVPILVVLFVGAVGLVAWHVKFFSRARASVEAFADRYSVNLDWIAICVRIIFFDYQVITKFTQMQDVVWPAPFSIYVNLLNLLFLDFKVWLPSIECSDFNQYTGLVMWTLGPVVLYVLALLWTCASSTVEACRKFTLQRGRRRLLKRKRSREFDQHSRAAASGDHAPSSNRARHNLCFVILETVEVSLFEMNQVAFGLMSLVHTLICVRIFQMFDCIEFDVGTETGPTIHSGTLRILSSDLSLDCESAEHKLFEKYAYIMAAVYVAIVPALMTLDKRRLRWSVHVHRLLSAPYKQE